MGKNWKGGKRFERLFMIAGLLAAIPAGVGKDYAVQ